MSARFQPVWLRFAVLAAVVGGILAGVWLFANLAGGG